MSCYCYKIFLFFPPFNLRRMYLHLLKWYQWIVRISLLVNYLDVTSLNSVTIGGQHFTSGNSILVYFILSDSSIIINCNITSLFIPSNSYNDVNTTKFSLHGFNNLQSLTIGDNCFRYVDDVDLSGLSSLRWISIGMNSFTNHHSSYAYDPIRSFSISNCPSLESIEMDRYSFSDYSSFSISSICFDWLMNGCSLFGDSSIWFRFWRILQFLLFFFEFEL